MNSRTMPHRGAIITGTGSAVPPRVITNGELSAMLGEDIDSIVSGTLGIDQRHWCAGDESTADLAEEAARAALAAAGAHADSIDLLIVATDTPEFVSPATASVVQGRLGLTRAGTFDVNAGGAGFVTALDIAWKYLRTDECYSRILVVGVYAISKFLDQHDVKTVVRFADGAGAVLLEACDDDGVLACELFADGRHCHGSGIFAGGTRTPITHTVLDAGIQTRLRVVQSAPASLHEEEVPRIVHAVLSRADHTPDDVHLWLWSEANRAMVEQVMHALGQPLERTHTIKRTCGDTGAAALPMMLDDAVRSGRLRDGELVVLTEWGAGLTLGALALRWHERSHA
jgi:3-oxoacyl-[acyl-carrier-protein] synthase III